MLNISLLGLQLGHAMWNHRNQDKNQRLIDHSVQAAEWAEKDRDKQETVLDHNVKTAEWAEEDREKQVQVLDHNVQSAQWAQEDRPEQKKILTAQAGDIEDSIQRQNTHLLLSSVQCEIAKINDLVDKVNNDSSCSIM